MLDHFIEVFFSIGMFVNAVLFIPQAVRLYQKKNSEDVSLITFAARHGETKSRARSPGKAPLFYALEVGAGPVRSVRD